MPLPQLAAVNELLANYETLRGQVVGAQAAGASRAGWVLLVRQGLAGWLQRASLPKSAPLPGSSASPVVVLPGLQSEVANVLITMVWSHYRDKPL